MSGLFTAHELANPSLVAQAIAAGESTNVDEDICYDRDDAPSAPACRRGRSRAGPDRRLRSHGNGWRAARGSRRAGKRAGLPLLGLVHRGGRHVRTFARPRRRAAAAPAARTRQQSSGPARTERRRRRRRVPAAGGGERPARRRPPRTPRALGRCAPRPAQSDAATPPEQPRLQPQTQGVGCHREPTAAPLPFALRCSRVGSPPQPGYWRSVLQLLPQSLRSTEASRVSGSRRWRSHQARPAVQATGG